MNNLIADIYSGTGSFSAGAYASAGHGVIAIKATEDTGYVNPDYAAWVKSAHEHRLAVWHYHFCRPENGNPIGQAEHFYETIREHLIRPGDYIVADLETDTPRNGAAWLTEFDRKLHSLSGYLPLLYTYLSYYTSGNPRITSKRLWIAAYSNTRPGNSRWQLGEDSIMAWQRTDGNVGPEPHSMAGIPGTCDVSQLSPSVYRAYKKHRP